MKILKFLTIPGVLVLSLAMPVAASASVQNNAHDNVLTDVTLTQTCDTSTGKICITLDAVIAAGNNQRTLEFDVFASSDTKFAQSLGKVTFVLPANQGPTPAPQHFTDRECFPVISPDKGTSFVIRLVAVTGLEGEAADLDFTVTIHDQTINVDFGNEEEDDIGPVTIFKEVGACVAVSPSPSPAATTATLASTGGLDFRFPLVGLVVLVAGAAVFLVSAARGRTASK